MKKILLILSLVVFLLNVPGFLVAQDFFENVDEVVAFSSKDTALNKINCQQGTIGDLFRKKDKPPKPPRKFMALILPNISSNPTNGFLLGIGGSFGWYMGPKENTRVSSAPFTVAVTSKSQLITFIKHNIYTVENRFFLQGDWKYLIYSQPTYGLGTNAPSDANIPSEISWMGEGTDSAYFPMKYNYLKIHEIINTRVTGELYAGIGYHLDFYTSIRDEYYRPAVPATDSTPAKPELITPHRYYCRTRGFDSTRYLLSGVSLNVVYDTRDNQICPYKGIYANINYRVNPTFLGSTKNSQTLWLEFRTYLSLSANTPRHLIGFWAFGDFLLSKSGSLPFLTMPYLGEDQRARSGRGFVNGRFRGNSIVYGEVEYRFPIWPCSHIIGGVLFANATTTNNTDPLYPERNVRLFEYVCPGVGIGLRIMINKYFRTNINLDYAIGFNRNGMDSRGFYFSGQETF